MNEQAVDPVFIDFTNNLVYNWGYTPGYNGEKSECPIRFNFIKNHYISGGDTDDDNYIFVEKGSKNSRGFFRKNMLNGITPDNYYSVVKFEGWDQDDIDEYKETEPITVPQTTVLNQNSVEAFVLNNAGVVLPQRDANDLRIINDVMNGTGHIVTNPDEYVV